MWTMAGLMPILTAAAALADDTPSGRLWRRGDHGYLCAGAETPLWITLPAGAFETGTSPVLTITMDKRIGIITHGTSSSAFLQPPPLVVPESISHGAPDESGQRTWTLVLPAEVENHRSVRGPRMALLCRPHKGMKPGRTQLELSLTGCAPATIAIDVLPPLHGVTPKRIRVGAFTYAGYDNPRYRAGIVRTSLASGMNDLMLMHAPLEGKRTLVEMFREGGGRTGVVYGWDDRQTIAEQFPDARRLDADGRPIAGKISYCWAFEQREEVVAAVAELIRKHNTPRRFDVIINDTEEGALVDGKAQGDLHSPIAIARFREQAGIADDVELTPEAIAENYPHEWVDFRCWESTEWAGLLRDAMRVADPTLLAGYYSGYHNAAAKADRTGQPLGTRAGYSTDWELLGAAGILDVGSAGYFGNAGDLHETRRALAGTPFIPGEMHIANFLHYRRMPPHPEPWAYRLMWALMTGGGEGVWTWYLQVYDAAAFWAHDQVAYVCSAVEDIVLDGRDITHQLVLPEGLSASHVFAHRKGARLSVVVLNPGEAIDAEIRWREPIPGAVAREVLTGESSDAASGIGVSVPAGGFRAYVVESGN